ncbi:hypothetical protein [Actinomadura sp. KC06]|uniref:hypothetical protein n=1 Tax=Actinomadura sp. KC06 TaxID=2530369 RepID=UPI001A9FDB8A|nr:hypothetical protein [Actinomadura sp. KC06]
MVSDPISVTVDLICHIESTLGRDEIEAVVLGVAGGRAKRRKLAQALVERPTVLTDGRSPGPRAVGDLLIALVRAGATTTSLPRCAECGKALQTLQRRGEDWYCSVCGPIRKPCAVCGEERPVDRSDRDGRPRCRRCPPDDGDPTQVVVEVVAVIDPALPTEVVAEAVKAAATQPSKRHQLAWAVQDRPDLLTGAGAEASTPSVLRLIDKLCDAGATGIVRPPCPGCGRVMSLHRKIKGRWLCRNCVAKSRAQPCSGCGRIREAAARDQAGRPLCPDCLVSDPANLEHCVNCGRRRVVSTRTPDGPLCPGCPPLPTLTCSICGQYRPCGISRLTGQPWCPSCQNRSGRCVGCETLKPIRSGTLDQPLCQSCTVVAFPDCPTCETSPRAGQCPHCRLHLRLRELLTGPDGATHPALRPLEQDLAATDPPGTALRWLSKEPVATVLADIAAGRRQLTHAALDELAPRPMIAHLRSVLVATGTLPPRDEQMARLERFLDDALSTQTDPGQRQLLHHYAVWHLLRRLRHRTNGQAATHEQVAVVQYQVRGAVVLLDWLNAQRLTLATCGQADLERWLSGDHTSCHRHAGHFVRWAARQRLTTLSFPATRWQGPTRALDDQARWDAAHRLLHDDTLPTRDRLQLATELPAALLARMLGIHIDVAVAWQHISAGDWTTYAADVSRRDPRPALEGRSGKENGSA